MRRLDPDVAADAMRAAGVEPLEPYRGVNAAWRCRCSSCGREVSPQLANIKSGQGACQWCAQRVVNPDEAARVVRAAGLEPLEPYPGARTPWRCRCLKCGSEVTPAWGSAQAGTGCLQCGHEKSNAARRLGHDAAAALMLERGLEPIEPFVTTIQPWLCRCMTCDREVLAWPCVKAVRRGCTYCSGSVIGATVAVDLMRAAGLEPLEPYPGSVHRWKCRCLKCGVVVWPRYGHVRQGGGCRWCAPSGFKAAADAVVYLLLHPRLEAVKVGVTGIDGIRLKAHRSRGWETLLTVRVPGVQALVIERHILDWWRKELNLPHYLSKHEMPQRGWTETVDRAEIDVAATMRRIKELAAAAGDDAGSSALDVA